MIGALHRAYRQECIDTGVVKPWLTVFEHNMGILRCAHWGKDAAIRLLRSIDTMGREARPVRVRTLGTSGTIRTAKRKFYHRPADANGVG